jgi:hypothetical protein
MDFSRFAGFYLKRCLFFEGIVFTFKLVFSDRKLFTSRLFLSWADIPIVRSIDLSVNNSLGTAACIDPFAVFFLTG